MLSGTTFVKMVCIKLVNPSIVRYTKLVPLEADRYFSGGGGGVFHRELSVT